MTISGVLPKIFLTILLLLLVAKPSIAQTDADAIWFWAWRSYDLDVETAIEQRGDIIAFTAEGQNNVILENVYPELLERMDDNTAFVTALAGEIYSLYYLTPTSAYPVMELFDQAYVQEFRKYASIVGFPSLVPDIIPAGEHKFLLADFTRGIYAIYDSVENTITDHNLPPLCEVNCSLRVSEDGRYIRYRTTDEANLLPYEIIEYDTLTRTNRQIYRKDAISSVRKDDTPRANCTPDQFGERWYCELFLNDYTYSENLTEEKTVIYADGTVETINPGWRLRTVDTDWYFLDLDSPREDCDGDCVINVFPNGNPADAFQFNMPSHDEISFRYQEVEMLSEKYLVLNLNGIPAFALSSDGDLTEIGSRHCCADPTSFDFYDQHSGYLVSYDQAKEQTYIWSTRPLEFLGSFYMEVAPGIRSTFRDYSLAVFYSGVAAAYSYLDNRLYVIDEDLFTYEINDYREYLDAFPGGVLLAYYGDDIGYWSYAQETAFRSDTDAIYRWTPDEGQTLLLEGAIDIPTLWKNSLD